MQNLQAQVSFKGVEVSVVVQEFIIALNTRGRDQTVDGIPDRDSPFPEGSEVSGGCDCERSATGFHDFKVLQCAFGFCKCIFVPYSLQNLTDCQVGNPKPYHVHLPMQPENWGSRAIVEVIDQNRRVDDDQNVSAAQMKRL
jgi:hypothetical protein